MRRLLLGTIAAISLLAITGCQQMLPPEVTKVTNSIEVACGATSEVVPVDWYFPDTPPKGLVWLQHGFVESKDDWATFAPQVASAGYLAMATSLPSTSPQGCNVQWYKMFFLSIVHFFSKSTTIKSAKKPSLTNPLSFT